MFFLSACKKKESDQPGNKSLQAIQYYNFPDKILYYPVDTSKTDTLSFWLDSTSQNSIKASAFFGNYFGTADPTHTNKVLAIALDSTYETLVNSLGECPLAAPVNSVITTNIIDPQGSMNTNYWSNDVMVVKDMVGPIMPCGSLKAGLMYLRLRKKQNGNFYAGWLRFSVTTDSTIFYDCAFCINSGDSLKAGQH